MLYMYTVQYAVGLTGIIFQGTINLNEISFSINHLVESHSNLFLLGWNIYAC
jgi:hypothetical protein